MDNQNIDVHDKLEELGKKFNKICNSPFKTWKEVKELGEDTGVYFICNGNDIIYIGSTNKFNVRSGDLRNISTHTLYKKILKEKLSNDELFNKIKKIIKIKKTTKYDVIKKSLTKEESHKFDEAKLETESFLQKKCKYKINKCKCNNKIEAEALEHFAIWIIKPKYNKTL